VEQLNHIRELIDPERLARYLDDRLGPSPVPLVIEKQSVGYSNETFFIDRGGERLVLRRPPRGPLLPTSHDMAREYRFLTALEPTVVKTPHPVLFCDDSSVIGAPFYLMQRERGVVIVDRLPPGLASVEAQAAIGQRVLEGLVALHKVDWVVAGLSGKPGGYISRQLSRWQSQADLTVGRVRDLRGLDDIGRWLRTHQPASTEETIVHGDYTLQNLMLSPEMPVDLVAIFDWEMATIGDPLADLGYLMQSWGIPDPQNERESPPVTALAGFPTREEMAQRYAEMTGREMRSFPFYHALALWKLAIICEGLYVQYKEGTAANPRSADQEHRVPNIIHRARRVIEKV
jgi:aminoglycoside phosphotransferase (APT) family kinase protein